MPITFSNIKKGGAYTRPQLAELWGYTSYHAIARGVVTPSGENKIVLFVTEQKQSSFEQYQDSLVGSVLEWEDPTDHFGENRMLKSATSNDEIQLFHRERHHSDFEYVGQLSVSKYEIFTDKSSHFVFKVE